MSRIRISNCDLAWEVPFFLITSATFETTRSSILILGTNCINKFVLGNEIGSVHRGRQLEEVKRMLEVSYFHGIKECMA